MNSKEQTLPSMTTGDAAVDGLLAGIAAGGLMAAYLILVGLAQGEAVGTRLGRFDPGQEGSPMTGLLAHLAVAGVYGALFGAGWRLTPSRWRTGPARVFGGLTFALALFIFAERVLLPGAASGLRAIPVMHFAVAHAVYGLTLGLAFHRGKR